jgi:DNA transformation protein
MSDDILLSKLMKQLSNVRKITGRKMFGGIGIFSEKVMFALIYNEQLFFRSTQKIAHKYSNESIQFQYPPRNSKMPYWSVSDKIMKDESKLVSWAQNAFHLAESLKRKKDQ